MKAPSVNRNILPIIAGTLWAIIGLILLSLSVFWLMSISLLTMLVMIPGVLGAVVIHRFGLSNVADKNIARMHYISPDKEQICLFAFQNVRGYFVVLIMVVLGYILRHAPIQRLYIAPIYTTMGLALILSSQRYFRRSRY
jgi:hypothetical protein